MFFARGCNDPETNLLYELTGIKKYNHFMRQKKYELQF